MITNDEMRDKLYETTVAYTRTWVSQNVSASVAVEQEKRRSVARFLAHLLQNELVMYISINKFLTNFQNRLWVLSRRYLAKG